MLEHHADPATGGGQVDAAPCVEPGLAVALDPAFQGGVQTGDAAHQGGLPAARRPDQRQYLPPAARQIRMERYRNDLTDRGPQSPHRITHVAGFRQVQ